MLARSHGYSGGNWATHNYYHADGNGNVTYLVDSGQGLAASYRYDAYGNTLASTGSLAGANGDRFSSKEVHVLHGALLLRLSLVRAGFQAAPGYVDHLLYRHRRAGGP